MVGLDATITTAQMQIEELKEFERTHRTRLKAYLEGRLLELDRRHRHVVQLADDAHVQLAGKLHARLVADAFDLVTQGPYRSPSRPSAAAVDERG